ncbi:MAG: DUF1643 domain-containing protein, partial [Kineosporiaceae bacterium]
MSGRVGNYVIGTPSDLGNFMIGDTRAVRAAADPVGRYNNAALATFTATGAVTLVAWGSHGRLRARSSQVAPLLTAPMCLGTTRLGEPR